MADSASPMADAPSILVVSADDFLRARIAAAFGARGLRPSVSADAAHGWDLFLRDLPPLVLVDWSLPGGGSARLVRQVRQRDEGAGVLVVAISPRGAGGEDPEGPLESGADDVLDGSADDEAIAARAAAIEKRLSERLARVRSDALRREAHEELERHLHERRERPGPALGILEEQIAARLHAEAEAERLSAALECAAEAIAITDPDGRFLWVNRTFEEVTGWGREEVKGKTPRILKSGRHDRDFYRQLWATLAVGETWRREFTNRRRSGELYEVEQVISPVRHRSGRTFAFVSIQRDIGERKRHEEELRAKSEELAVARDEALAASRAKSAFLGTVSPELRTPLNAILGFAELLDETAGSISTGDLRRDLARIRGAAVELARKVDDLLDVSRIESGEVTLDVGPSDATLLLREAADVARKGADPSAGPLTVDVPDDLGAVEADPERLRHIVAGLLANAFRHGLGSPVALRARRDALGVEVVIADSGPGIPAERLAAVFTPFSAAGGKGGLGLTLAVAHRLALLMGGELSVESGPGQGTAARLRLRAVARKEPPL